MTRAWGIRAGRLVTNSPVMIRVLPALTRVPTLVRQRAPDLPVMVRAMGTRAMHHALVRVTLPVRIRAIIRATRVNILVTLPA